jgi:hypothetical protein
VLNGDGAKFPGYKAYGDKVYPGITIQLSMYEHDKTSGNVVLAGVSPHKDGNPNLPKNSRFEASDVKDAISASVRQEVKRFAIAEVFLDRGSLFSMLGSKFVYFPAVF